MGNTKSPDGDGGVRSGSGGGDVSSAPGVGSSSGVGSGSGSGGSVVGRYRWVICGLLFAASAINYIDRQIIGVLKPTLQLEYGWTESAFANIVFWFQAAYAVGYLGFGKFIDRVGARVGFAAAVVVWTIAHVAHALVTSIGGFIAARLVLGLGESGNYPAGLKAIAEWFPQRERALAAGILTAGANVGAVVTPLIVPAITVALGWRASFVVTGSFSLVWLIFWLKIYRRPEEHPRVGAAELAFINSDREAPAARNPANGAGARDTTAQRGTTPLSDTTATGNTALDDTKPIPWRRLLTLRETWAFTLGPLPHRPHLVDVPILAARFLRQALPPRPGGLRAAARRGVCRFGLREHRRRLAFLAAHPRAA